MTIQTFGVTYTTVRQDYFPQFTGEFSATSNPTSTTVTRHIQEEAADLAGRLRLKAIAAADIVLDTSSEAYAWCRKTLTLMVAAREVRVMNGCTPELQKSLQDEAERRLKLLTDHGVEVMGLGATVADSTDEPMGPTSHIDDLDLETGEGDGVTSDVAPVIRRADQL